MRLAAAIISTAALAAAMAAGAAAQSPIVAAIAAERAANGLPGDLAENSEWSRRCAAHVAYMTQNALLAHMEDPSLQGYSDLGAWAGRNAVLAEGNPWATGDPFESAPGHLIQLLSPRLAQVGAAESGEFSCVTTLPGYTRRNPTNAIYVYPGPGTAFIPAAEKADERPYVPQEFVGIAAGRTTGPYLFAFADGPWATAFPEAQVVTASLAGPGGFVALKTLDRTTPTYGPYLPPGAAMLIPVAPLRERAAYTASVTLVAGGKRLTRVWSFRTAATNVASETVVPVPGSPGSLTIQVKSRAPSPQVTIAKNGVTVAVPLTGEAGSYTSAALRTPLPFQVCLVSGGGASGWTRVVDCLTWTSR